MPACGWLQRVRHNTYIVCYVRLVADHHLLVVYHSPRPANLSRTVILHNCQDIARGRTYSRLGRGPGGVTDLHAAKPTRGAHHCREVPRKDDTTATFSLRLERAIL